MDFDTYLRPREKLVQHGPSALNDAELLQLILGPGSSSSSGAIVARRVEVLIKDGPLGYDSLVQTDGIGDAKACRVLALVELAGRLGSL
ncbi:hypothetical protein GW930_01365 [Candidatus Saccharibacteria bacterium]|nr:hypothetical protein [Candidatus Saccharibacteria bacterium]